MLRLAAQRHQRTFLTNIRFYSTQNTPLLDELRARGLIQQTSQGLEDALESRACIYLGADPTARSLHAGHLLPLMVLLHFFARGHTVIQLVGEGTAQVGDPSGRSTSRSATSEDTLKFNTRALQTQLSTIFTNAQELLKRSGCQTAGELVAVNNADWWRNMNLVHFMSSIGPHLRLNQMLSRESVKARLQSDAGLGYNEFSYQALQAYDFWYLQQKHKCNIQLGGNDQWGNITAGLDLVSRLGGKAYGITVPLLTTPSGEKFGKSAGNAVFLDSSLTPKFQLYQHFIRAPDSVVESYLKMFTFIPLPEIERIVTEHNNAPESRTAQKVLAERVVDLIYGPGAGNLVSQSADLIYGKFKSQTLRPSADDLLTVFEGDSFVQEVPRTVVGEPILSLLKKVYPESAASLKRSLQEGSVYIGPDLLSADLKTILEDHHLVDHQLVLVRLGKKNVALAKLV
ncbi:hypothetical protein CANCADRAFT_84858 [Tortispora caseinolytica NRRL Y-17796]|uniref:Tyrosine--tRNA ligase n=1 Tax=Tortispora caseinolytica NRRL Y-17796 TaxID=767744 RepID=A0A1E4TKN4_9ASCO|nr:hypothetical protein CANCADRAFT_84858 [Tortispora caseinolytica NRRL Y-17796]